jgi:hypothetical protein
VATVVLSAQAAIASAAEPFDASRALWLLPDAATLGTVTGVIGQTNGHNGTGACAGPGAEQGYPHAAVYRHVASHTSTLEIEVADEDGATEVCRVSVYRHTESAPFDDPFDSEQRAGGEVAACSGTSCTVVAQLIADATYYVTVWSSPPDEESRAGDATFRYSASVRRPAPLSASMTGARIRDCHTWNEVVVRDTYTVSFTIAATGVVRIYLDVFSSGGWRRYSTFDRTITSNRVTWSSRASGSGMWRFTASYLGNDTTLPSSGRAGPVHVRYVTPKWSRFADGGVLLLTPRYRQQRALSCEASSYRSAHNYFRPGHLAYDTQVYDKTGWDRRRPNVSGGCNPDRAFCGNVDGLMMRDGYGVHVDPVARAARIFDGCRPGVVLRGYSYAALASYVNDGFPVVVWGAHSGPTGIYRKTWRAWDSHYVVAWSVEHTWAVIGFRGNPANPTSFIILNPSNGVTTTVSVAFFNNFVKYFRTALVVRG